MIHLDTSLLIDALTGKRLSFPAMMQACEHGEAFQLSAVTLYEWLRGPRTMREIADQEELFPSSAIVSFDEETARLGSMLYRSMKRARGREADIAIAATAIRNKAKLWTLNVADFADIPGLQLFKPR